MLDAIHKTLGEVVQDDAATGLFRCKRNIFTDPELFELEMKHIFEGNWIYMAHESQVPKVNDYFTIFMGRQPVFIARNKNGELNAFVNACSHRGAMLCRHKKGNKANFTCPFHGWTFNNSGKLLKVKDGGEGAGYPEQFNKDGSHDLTKVARFENYRGFLFGSLNPDVVPLKEHLGEAAKIIDMIVDQSPEGLEVVRGSSTYVYDGNWKLQTENGADGYHMSATHWNYAATTSRRKEAAQEDHTRAMSAGGWAKQGGGFYSFENGHLLLWTNWSNPEDRPNRDRREELAAQFGQAQADWMVQIFGALGQFERDLIQERTRAGLAAAAARGRKGGRKPAITEDKLRRAREHIAKGLTVREAAMRVKVGKTALYEAFKTGSVESNIALND